MKDRRRFFVSPNGDNGWKVKQESVHSPLKEFKRKEEAKEFAVDYAKKFQKSQVVIQKKDGTFETEYTYGSDPSRTKG